MSNERDFLEPDLSPDDRANLRAWSAAPAPGEERVAKLRVTAPASGKKVSRLRKISHAAAQHLATGALLFIGGYFLGQKQESALEKPAIERVAASGSVTNRKTAPLSVAPASVTQSSPRIAPPTALPTTPPAQPHILKSQIAAVGPTDQKPAECKSPQVYQGKDGHFRIDTVLCETGSRATWVINPRLEIANVSQQSPEENLQ